MGAIIFGRWSTDLFGMADW